MILKVVVLIKEPTAGNDEESAPRDNQKVNGSTNAKRINLELRSAIIEQQNIIIHPATPPHEKEEARRELRRLTRSQNATPQDTAGDAYADAAAVGGSDDGQVDAAPDTTATPGPPAAEQKAPDEPDYLRQAQDAERELKQARIKHSQRRRRDNRRRQSVQYMGPRVQQPPPERNRFPARQGPVGPGRKLEARRPPISRRRTAPPTA